MAELSAFQLIPLLLSKDERRLLVVGWHSSILAGLWGKRQEIEVHVTSDCRRRVTRQLAELSSFDSTRIRINQSIPGFSPTAVLVCGIGPFGWKNALPQEVNQCKDIPFAAIYRGRDDKLWSSQFEGGIWIMEGLPSSDLRSSLWFPKDKGIIPWSMFSPRSRLERPWMRLFALLRRLKFLPFQEWKVMTNGSASILGQLITKVAPSHSGPGRFWYHSRNNCLFIFLTSVTPALIIKIPLDLKARDSLKLHHQHLSILKTQTEYTDIKNLLPETQLLSVGDYVVGVETKIPGISAYQLLMHRQKLRRVLSFAAEVLTEWQMELAIPSIIDDKLFEIFWEKPLRPLKDILGVRGREFIFTEILEVLKRNILGKYLPLVPIHGDYWLNNIICDQEDQRINGILDWDASCPQGLPLLDISHLLYWRTNYFYSLHSRLALFQTIKRNFSNKSGEILREYCIKLDISVSQLPFLFCRYWLGEAANRIDVLLTKPEFLRAIDTLHRYMVSLR